MTPALLGKKIGTTRIYDEKGAVVPVTVVEATPNHVTQVKTVDSDGYNAVQLGYGAVKPRHSNYAIMGHCGKAGIAPHRHFREIKLKDASDKSLGDEVGVDVFEGVQYVDVIGTSKGKGTAGVMKRHNFQGQGASHGVKRVHRHGGSIGSSADPSRVVKGTRMAGHYGHERVTVRYLKVVRIDPENNMLLVRGGIPGPNGSFVVLRPTNKKR